MDLKSELHLKKKINPANKKMSKPCSNPTTLPPECSKETSYGKKADDVAMPVMLCARGTSPLRELAPN